MYHTDLKIQKLPNFVDEMRYATRHSAGFDLFAAEDHVFRPGQTFPMPLGFATEMDDDVHARIEARSGLALKNLVVLTGVIDADYRGEWKAILHFIGPCKTNDYAETFRIARGDRVAQAVLRPTAHAGFDYVDSLSDTSRGAGGFGSTGR